MNLQLLVVAGPDRGRFFPLPPTGITIIGSSQMHADFRLHDIGVSRVHCELEMDGDHFVLADQESESGTFVNGQRITKQELKLRDIIRVGETELLFQQEGGKPEPAGAAAGKPASLPMEWVDKLVGTTLGHYAIDSVVGQGHVGLVFLAHDLRDNRVAALKVLHPAFPKNEEELRPFSQAIKSLLPLRHPNLVTVYGAGKTGPYCWVARDYVEGQNLTKEIEQARTATTRDWKRALRVGVSLARALDYAEQHQLGHGNLTPQNILVRAGDQVIKITDLMLAKALEGSLIQQAIQPGKLRAEYLYLAPEQTHRHGVTDHRTDIHAVGALIYSLMTGRPPFEGTSPNDTLAKIRQAEVEKPRKFEKAVPIDFDALVRKMLSKKPEDRHQTFSELAGDLEELAEGMGVAL